MKLGIAEKEKEKFAKEPWGWSIKSKHYEITIERRQFYCDRGNFIAKAFPVNGDYLFALDDCEGWPRYYFDLDRAQLEILDWLKKRREI